MPQHAEASRTRKRAVIYLRVSTPRQMQTDFDPLGIKPQRPRKEDDALVFVGRTGKVLRYNSWRRSVFDPAVETAGFEDVTPHDLRASHGTWIAERYGVMAAAKRLGHANASVTTRHYARASAGADDRVAAGLDRARRTSRAAG